MDISIIGCGWLGKDLARVLKDKHRVFCYQRRHEPLDDGLLPAYLPKEDDPFWQSQCFILALSTRDDYLSSLERFLRWIPDSSRIILMSSTSVYQGYEVRVDEQMPIIRESLQFSAEQLVRHQHPDTIVLRLGGLMGEDRIAGKWQNSTRHYPDGPVNYIHKEDLLRIIPQCFELPADVYNLVAPQHPLRSEVHAKNARRFGYTPKHFDGISRRIVSGEELPHLLGYSFIYPDPLGFWDDL